MITILVAMTKQGVIGLGDKMPWHIPKELKHFRRTTLQHAVIMGRKTYESLPTKPLPGRLNLVISRTKQFPHAMNSRSVDEVIDMICARKTVKEEIFVIGGKQIYEEFLPYANRILASIIKHPYQGDVYFPGFCATNGPKVLESYREFDVVEYKL